MIAPAPAAPKPPPPTPMAGPFDWFPDPDAFTYTYPTVFRTFEYATRACGVWLDTALPTTGFVLTCMVAGVLVGAWCTRTYRGTDLWLALLMQVVGGLVGLLTVVAWPYALWVLHPVLALVVPTTLVRLPTLLAEARRRLGWPDRPLRGQAAFNAAYQYALTIERGGRPTRAVPAATHRILEDIGRYQPLSSSIRYERGQVWAYDAATGQHVPIDMNLPGQEPAGPFAVEVPARRTEHRQCVATRLDAAPRGTVRSRRGRPGHRRLCLARPRRRGPRPSFSFPARLRPRCRTSGPCPRAGSPCPGRDRRTWRTARRKGARCPGPGLVRLRL